jgi:hypothetical protein
VRFIVDRATHVFELLNKKIEKLEHKLEEQRLFIGNYLTLFGDGKLAKEADLLLKNDRSAGQEGME